MALLFSGTSLKKPDFLPAAGFRALTSQQRADGLGHINNRGKSHWVWQMLKYIVLITFFKKIVSLLIILEYEEIL